MIKADSNCYECEVTFSKDTCPSKHKSIIVLADDPHLAIEKLKKHLNTLQNDWKYKINEIKPVKAGECYFINCELQNVPIFD